MKKIDILSIHGGTTFRNRVGYLDYLKNHKRVYMEPKEKWSGKYLDDALGKNYRIIRPQMPLKDNAKYEDWKIYFEKHLPLLSQKYILIGTSLGGIFLARYLSENKLKHKPLAVFMVAPPFDDTVTGPGEELVGGFKLKNDLSLITENCKNVTMMFSEDDPTVPKNHAEKYRAKLPEANIKIYKGKNGHFIVGKLPEIVRMIKKL